MACRLAENARTVFDPTALLIISAEIQPADPRKRNCSGAHRTRLETDVKVAARQPGVADRSGGFPQGDHLRVCRRVFQFLNPVAGTPDDTTGPAVDHDAPDRHLSPVSSRRCFLQSDLHKIATDQPGLRHHTVTFQIDKPEVKRRISSKPTANEKRRFPQYSARYSSVVLGIPTYSPPTLPVGLWLYWRFSDANRRIQRFSSVLRF